MSRGKYQAWLEPESLERIANWAANGLTDAEIAKSMGIRRETLSVWKQKHPHISNAIKRGRLMSCEAVENALFAKATGQVVVSESVEDEAPDGRVTRRTVTKTVPPDTAAIIFYLKNRMPDRYADRRTTEVAVTAPTISLGMEPRRADD